MPDEEMDDIIRDASSQHHPTYDDKAWGKMENLLDKHLPQKKDKRKYLLFLLLFLLVDAGLLFVFFHPKKNNGTQTATVARNSEQDVPYNSHTLPVANDKVKDVVPSSQKDNTQQPSPAPSVTTNTDQQTKDASITSITTDNNNSAHKTHKTRISTKGKFKSHITYSSPSDIADNTGPGDAKTAKQNDPATTTRTLNDNNSTGNNSDTAKKDNSTTGQLPKLVAENKKDTLAAKKETANKTSKKEKRTTNIFDKNFAFTASAGPGFSYVGLDQFGKTTISYGAGIRYNFAKRFAVRTGFYVTKKIYSAAPSDYHPPKIFWTYNPDLQKINANCKVYEIPVSISYDIAKRKKHIWYGALGLTSYIMKQEVYDYYSKDPNGQTYLSTATVDDQNKNIFSIITLSGGYQYNISNRFSIAAEPYIELPMNGIGFGKIKLNSGGLLFTAIFKPFAH